MRVYLDGLFYRSGGIGRYYEFLLKSLLNSCYIERIYTAVPIKFKQDFERDFSSAIRSGKVYTIWVHYRKFSIKAVFFMPFILFNLLYKHKVEKFIYPHVNVPLVVPSRLMVVIHDLIPFYDFWEGGLIRLIIFKLFVRKALLNSKFIIVVSNSTKMDVLSSLWPCEKKIKIIYEHADVKFINDKLLKKQNFVLFVGRKEKHKNLDNLIKSFFLIKRKLRKIYLVLVGPEEFNVNTDFVKEKISPTDSELKCLYNEAELLVLPSFCEGFGLPPFEAVASGTPCLLSKIEVFREIWGGRIACLDPFNPVQMGEKILNVIMNSKLKKKLLFNAMTRFFSLNRDKIFAKYISLIKRL